MLRLLALVLVLDNALLRAAQLGVFEPLTAASNAPPQREPERLQRQVHPEWVQILSADAASAALRAAAASASQAAQPGACLEAGPFADTEAEAAQRTARVVTLRPAQSQTLLRVPAADATLRARLAGLKMPSGPGFGDCAAEVSAAAASQPG